jgi:hypothetical protein
LPWRLAVHMIHTQRAPDKSGPVPCMRGMRRRCPFSPGDCSNSTVQGFNSAAPNSRCQNPEFSTIPVTTFLTQSRRFHPPPITVLYDSGQKIPMSIHDPSMQFKSESASTPQIQFAILLFTQSGVMTDYPTRIPARGAWRI